ncbi:MAG: hypothetical protein AB1646_12100 [Thermodesulfobacteriota bacterium]
MDHRIIPNAFAAVITGVFMVLTGVAQAQVPLPPRAPEFQLPPGQVPQGVQPQAQPPLPPQAPPPQQGAGFAYTFRPDLTNPQFGQCLGLEKQWKGLWQQYYEAYQNATQMYPGDPRWAQVTHYLANLKQQLDAAWHQFSSQCVQFREPKR